MVDPILANAVDPATFIGSKTQGCTIEKVNDQDYVVVYTDGSTHMSNSFAFARSGWGVYYADHHPLNVAAPLLADLHTTVRAELRAIVHVLRTADVPVLIRSDCKSVVDNYRQG